jgi:hypothetical protein
MRKLRLMGRKGGRITSGQGIGWPRLPHAVRSVLLLVLLLIAACLSSPVPRNVADNYQEMFNQDLFHERVKLLNSVKPGATREDLLKTLGKPQAREVTPDNYRIYIYRVRCYMGPEPLSRWPRHMSAIYEARFIMDPQGRVSAIQTNP